MAMYWLALKQLCYRGLTFDGSATLVLSIKDPPKQLEKCSAHILL